MIRKPLSDQTSSGLKSSSQTLKAVLGVRELVFSGAVPPGERLTEVTMSERLGISRTPVRAALSRLEQEGILVMLPAGGFAVRAFSQADIIDAIELRGVLEGTAARFAAERGVDEDLLERIKSVLCDLDTIVGRPQAELDVQAYIDRNASFHDLLKAAAASTIVSAEIDRAVRLPFAGPSAFLNAQVDIPEFRASLVIGQGQHRAIVDAIEKRQGARAEALAREHALLARQNLDFILENKILISRVPGLSLMSE